MYRIPHPLFKTVIFVYKYGHRKYFSIRGHMESDQQTGDAPRPRKSGSANKSGEKRRGTAGKTKPTQRKRFEIDIFRDWCKSCGICAAFCPRECIRLNDEGAPAFIDSDKCTGCGWCEVHCPDFAISVHEKNDPARAESI